MDPMRFRIPLTVLLASLCIAISGASAKVVGTLAAIEGDVDVGRSSVWEMASVGDSVAMGDEIKTGPTGRAKILFEDESLLSIGVDSHITIDDHIFDPSGSSTSIFSLLRGKLNALVTEYYKTAGSQYEVRTATATCGVRGTEFVVRYDEVAEKTDVTVVSGIVAVHSLVDPTGPGVLVTASEVTTVEDGELPTEPARIDPGIIDRGLEDFEFIGASTIGGAGVGNAVASGAAVPAPEQAGISVAPLGVGAPDALNLQNDASTLAGAPPAAVIGIGQLGLDLGQPK